MEQWECLVCGYIYDPQRAALARQMIDRKVDVSEHRDRLVHDDFDLKSLLS